MRKLINMDMKSEVGLVDWEFIHDMQDIVPELITPEVIHLNKKFIGKIPLKWNKIKSVLYKHIDPEKTIYLTISDIENMGNEFKARGILKDKNGKKLSFHKIILFDKDRFEDDYIGGVISDKKGEFTLSFGKNTFSDFGIESHPDIYFKIYSWKKDHFEEIMKVIPEISKKIETKDKKTIYEFGIVTV